MGKISTQFKIADYYAEEQEDPPGETTVESVAAAMSQLFHARWNLPKAAHFCGMTVKELKYSFHEYVRRRKPVYNQENNWEYHKSKL